VLNDAVGIENGFMTTIHSYTGDQPTLGHDAQGPLSGPRRGAVHDPDVHGCCKPVGLVLPELNGKLDGVAIRVPTPNVSVVDFKFVASRETSKDEINGAIRSAAQQRLKNVLGWTDQPNVSDRLQPRPAFLVFHMDQTKVLGGTLVRILSWYDNEWGFSNRMSDTAVAMAKTI
jgi:glyceraldehyde 3-phosphate dehydrogenase